MIKPITSIKIDGRRVVLRAGFDVPLKQSKEHETFQVADETRIKDILPTLEYLINEQAIITIISHLDRPNGQWMKDKSLWPVAEELGKLLNRKVVRVADKLPSYDVPHIYFLDADICQQDYSKLTKNLKPGAILFLENLRFYPGEESNDPEFVKVLAAFGDLFVNEAFSVAHRNEASTTGIAKALPSYAGISLAQEIKVLDKISKRPDKPMIAIVGGAKISTKVDTINALAKHADHILVGGALANAFIKAKGYEIGTSKVDEVDVAKDLLRNHKDKIILPLDIVVAKSQTDAPRVCALDKILPSESIYDIGPKTISKFSELIKQAKTIVWNGPLGLIEIPRYAFGSKSIAQSVAMRSKGKAYAVVGGGETIETLDMAKVSEFIDHISTGGGAMLEYLGGKKLPAIKALDK